MAKTFNELLKTRLRGRLDELDRSPIAAAERVPGIGRDYLNDFLSNGKKQGISTDKFEAVASAVDWTVSDLLNVSKRPQSRALAAFDQTTPEIDIRGGASYGGGFGQEDHTVNESGSSISSDRVRAEWGIPAPFLRDELRVRPGRVHILPIRGDSMEESLYDGDRVIIDLDDIDVSQGGIFALLDDNAALIVKQVEIVRGDGARRLRCTSRNSNYTPFDLQLVEPVKIIGRVACRITRL